MGSLSRTKGQSGERELAALLSELTGRRIARRVRQHAGDSDLVGLPDWCIESKRARSAPLSLVAREWWPQAVTQANAQGTIPLLCFRADRQPWRAVWPVWPVWAILPELRTPCTSFDDAVMGDLLTWWRLCRRLSLLSA
ncbi:putative PDDEXK endonuclease [Extensimonas vulgaris]|uniref:Holliday junction resolvase n=1 Tax=Extensimonas vulgaris TaxID=1031594 RepID=A0A369AKB8_9BURK|nr:hypothetical protein [Extensimonas vulgaris]RCX09800.1 hypothetical protein DFR45_104168 [Extensimonas vulgaris]TWI39430.1 hypothetical protein IP95_01335 [Extensimonas vulgaris]TXD15672.1 hypothetical protein FUT63_07070 [Extensimonas vulgaris]